MPRALLTPLVGTTRKWPAPGPTVLVAIGAMLALASTLVPATARAQQFVTDGAYPQDSSACVFPEQLAWSGPGPTSSYVDGVLRAPEVIDVYWPGSQGHDPMVRALFKDVVTDLFASDLWTTVMPQYVMPPYAGDAPPVYRSRYDITTLLTLPAGTTIVDDGRFSSQVQKELAAQISAGLPFTSRLPDEFSDIQTLYVVHFPPDVVVTIDSSGGVSSCSAFCGYHTSGYTEPTGEVCYPGFGCFPVHHRFAYIVIPDYSQTACGTQCGLGTRFDRYTESLHHELVEAITDPFSFGWLNGCGAGEELADVCSYRVPRYFYAPRSTFSAGVPQCPNRWAFQAIASAAAAACMVVGSTTDTPCDETCDGCDIEGVGCVPAGTVDPTNPCAICNPAESASAWSPRVPSGSGAQVVCRSAQQACELAAFCPAGGTACPAQNGIITDTSHVCRPAAGVCDVAETCTGNSAACPPDAKSTAVCRGSAGVCDVAEVCDGVSNACPANEFRPNGTECRASAGVCDPVESCTGNAATCPSDAKSTAVCRSATGVCDVAETCDGVSNACPTDAFKTASSECRPSGGVCDPAESCTGNSATCPSDAKSTAVCRAPAGVCDVAESCDGVTNACPTDAFKPASTECRASAGVCDVAESCTGNSATCPADAKSTAACRAAAGVCDVAESCDGVSNACPTDAFKPSSTQCRASAGVCDLAESCTGNSATCPADAKSTAVCRPSAGLCDVAESCSGSSNGCPADAVQPSGATCGAQTGDCDLAETCDGTRVSCPADTGNRNCGFQSDPQILSSSSTCQQYRDRLVPTLGAVTYTLTKGSPAVINAVSAGVFSLYDGLKLAANGTLTVSENTGSWLRAIAVNQVQVILYDLSCNTLHVGTLSVASNGNVTITNVPAGNYILSVKYDANGLSGYAPPTASSTYTFAVQANGLNSGSTAIPVKKK